MNDMLVTEKLYALQGSPIFQGLDESEILLVAEVAQLRSFAADAVICSVDADSLRLYIPIRGGGFFESGRPAGKVFDVPSLLFNDVMIEGIRAGSEGCDCLTISKGHFFTLLSECPSILVNMMAVVGDSSDGGFAGVAR